MSLPATTASSSSSTSTTACKTYSGKDKTYECLISFYIVTLLTLILCLTPAITRLLIFLQPNPSTFTVDSSTLSVSNLSSTAITADWSLTLSTTNPNKNSMCYDHISAVALKNTSLALSTASLSPFCHPGFRRKTVEVEFSGMVVELLNYTGSGGVLGLSMELRASASYRGWTWPSKTDRIKVVCGGFQVDFPFNVTSFEFGSSNCSVSGKWKKLAEKCSQIFWNYVFISVIVIGVLALSL